jgi:hypothetical protein
VPMHGRVRVLTTVRLHKYAAYHTSGGI